MKVLCVKWGDKYSPDYVTRLKSMCSRHLPEHDFVCVTEHSVEGVDCIPLVCDLPIWWQKLGLLQPGLFPGENWYFDLDVVISSAVSMPAYDGKLWALDDFSYSLRRPRHDLDDSVYPTLGGVGCCNSSVMYWHGDAGARAWESFRWEDRGALHGDQNAITKALWPDHLSLFPEGTARSYRYGGPENAPITVFHGDPKPHQVTDKWVHDHWR
jgi:hypothetical protein